MNHWELADCLEPLEEFSDNPTVQIGSEEELREQLELLRQRKQHGHVVLTSPDQDKLSISIGGPYASFGWVPSAAEYGVIGEKDGVTDHLYTDQPVDCWGEGISAPIDPDHLFPVALAIEAIVHFYNTHELPKWISWQEWDPIETRWTVTPAQTRLQAVTTP